MSGRKRFTLLAEATLCSFGLMVFSFFIHYKFPLQLLSFAALLISALIISRNLRSFSDLKKITGENISFKITLLYIIFGIALGIVLAVRYRRHLDISLFPESFHLFVIAAAFIGCMEELVFRGFIQEYVKSINRPFSILFSTLSHTGYKCCLFLSPVITTNVDVGFLAFWTFIVGILFGTIRHLSKSLLPSLSAHVLFDILVYAEFVRAPWWVW
ncbi:MAG: CPBP family glutamic-type intramembrane protease [Bacteroidales bacterium]|nr:CPBP family glutamic-type intramembrane protease [Bacteroidales bacterium]